MNLIKCFMTNSTWFKGAKNNSQPVGILWHDTAGGNPTLKRYVQPYETDANYSQMIELLGKNKYGNDWNHIIHPAGLNAWIGQLADGSVATIQTGEWTTCPWGCGGGSHGSCNGYEIINGKSVWNGRHWIQFEICDDAYKSVDYFNQVYKEAVELTAYLCELYNIDPIGFVDYGGIQVPTILCHYDSYKLGVGHNHYDVYSWFNKMGKTMEDVRRDVQTLTNKKNAKKEGIYTKGQKEQITKNFVSTEFDCHESSCKETLIDGNLVKCLQLIRNHFNKPVTVLRGYCCDKQEPCSYHKNNSLHLTGGAVDIFIADIPVMEVAEYAEEIGFNGIGVYTLEETPYVHLELAQEKDCQLNGLTITSFKQFNTMAISTNDLPMSEQVIWDFLKSQGLNDCGAAALMANLWAESRFIACNLQGYYEKKFGMSDLEYTAAVDNGVYTNFVNDGAGYGLAQWTYWSLKQQLYDWCKQHNSSIGDGMTQLRFLAYQLSKDYPSVWETLQNASSVKEASDKVVKDFERPANQSEGALAERATKGEEFYNKFREKLEPPIVEPPVVIPPSEDVTFPTEPEDTKEPEAPQIADSPKPEPEMIEPSVPEVVDNADSVFVHLFKAIFKLIYNLFKK